MEVQPIQEERILGLYVRTLHSVGPRDRGAYVHPKILKVEL